MVTDSHTNERKSLSGFSNVAKRTNNLSTFTPISSLSFLAALVPRYILNYRI